MTIDLGALSRSGSGIVWNGANEDLNLNLMVLAPGGTIAEHVNVTVDVLLIGVRGEGTVSIDGKPLPLGPQMMVWFRDPDRNLLSVHQRR